MIAFDNRSGARLCRRLFCHGLRHYTGKRRRDGMDGERTLIEGRSGGSGGSGGRAFERREGGGGDGRARINGGYHHDTDREGLLWEARGAIPGAGGLLSGEAQGSGCRMTGRRRVCVVQESPNDRIDEGSGW